MNLVKRTLSAGSLGGAAGLFFGLGVISQDTNNEITNFLLHQRYREIYQTRQETQSSTLKIKEDLKEAASLLPDLYWRSITCYSLAGALGFAALAVAASGRRE